MLSERLPDGVQVRAPAKVNLFLEVLVKRSDGYHEIATLMVTIGLFDSLFFQEDSAGRLSLTCDDPRLSTGPDNLVTRAAQLLRQRTGCTKGARIRLIKRIPMAAGLAGGSSDAAATLTGLNWLWNLGLERARLSELGAELGSDISFFFHGPAAWCTGRGERVEPLQLGRPFFLVLACPPVGLSTADVYRGVSVPEQPQTGHDFRRAVVEGEIEAIGRGLHNRLQPVAEKLSPAVGALLARLEQLRPAGQAMSGSGTTVFALCRDYSEALRVARGLGAGPAEEAHPRVLIVRSCS
jgi:4-diphosphocytidyl-2-C-methyl-D-erythritol kinase